MEYFYTEEISTLIKAEHYPKGDGWSTELVVLLKATARCSKTVLVLGVLYTKLAVTIYYTTLFP